MNSIMKIASEDEATSSGPVSKSLEHANEEKKEEDETQMEVDPKEERNDQAENSTDAAASSSETREPASDDDHDKDGGPPAANKLRTGVKNPSNEETTTVLKKVLETAEDAVVDLKESSELPVEGASTSKEQASKADEATVKMENPAAGMFVTCDGPATLEQIAMVTLKEYQEICKDPAKKRVFLSDMPSLNELHGQGLAKRRRKSSSLEAIDWDDYFKLLVTYKKKHKNLKIQQKYSTIQGIRLGRWVHNQRTRLKPCVDLKTNKAVPNMDATTKDRVNRLCKLGFDWGSNSPALVLEWDDYFELLQTFKENNGHLKIQVKYETPEGIKLGRWCDNQRNRLKPYVHGGGKDISCTSITRERIEKLNKAGFLWESARSSTDKANKLLSWYHFYDLLLDFKKEHDHVLVPHEYVTADGGHRLWAWVSNQRKVLKPLVEDDDPNFKMDPTSKDRIDRLNEIGFVWGAGKNMDWDQYFQMLVDYKDNHGNLRIPQKYETPDGIKLGRWANNQRTRLRLYMYMEAKGYVNTISQGRVEKLNGIQFPWESGKGSNQWTTRPVNQDRPRFS